MNLRETYNRIAEDWHRDHSDDDWWVEGTDAFITFVGSDAEVLDVGCGSGTKSAYLTEHGLRVTGIDIAEKQIEIAKREVPDASFAVGSMYDLASLGKSFNGLFAQASLLHIPKKDAAAVVAQMADALLPEGYLYIAVKETKAGQPDEAVLKENDYGYEYERFFSYFTTPELEEYMTSAGLTPVWKDSKLTGKTTWLQIVGRKSV